jgi:hypothetical protein
MPGINQLSEQATVQSSDQFPIYSPNNGQPRKVSANAIREFVLEGPDAAPVLLPNGISDISSLFAMRIASPVAVSVGTSFANIPNYSPFPLLTGEPLSPRTLRWVSLWPRGTWTSLCSTWP